MKLALAHQEHTRRTISGLFAAAAISLGPSYASSQTRDAASELASASRGSPRPRYVGYYEVAIAEQQRRAMQVRAVFAPGSDPTVLYGVRMANPSLRLCYQRELRTRPSAEGVITARFRIGADGRVSNTTARGLFSDEMLRCVSQRIQAVRFAARAQALDTYVRLILHPSP